MANPSPAKLFKEGKTVGSQYQQWRNAVTVAANTKSKLTRRRALDEAASKLLDLAIAGDIAAIKELGNRLDGQAHQSVSIDQQGNDRSITVQLSFIKPPDALSHVGANTLTIDQVAEPEPVPLASPRSVAE